MEIIQIPLAYTLRVTPWPSHRPSERIWWNEPIHKVELIWVIVAFLWGLFMFFFMIAWHFIGQQNLSQGGLPHRAVRATPRRSTR